MKALFLLLVCLCTVMMHNSCSAGRTVSAESFYPDAAQIPDSSATKSIYLQYYHTIPRFEKSARQNNPIKELISPENKGIEGLIIFVIGNL